MTTPDRRFDAVVFDLGGVLIDLAPLRAFVERHGIDLSTFFAAALDEGAHHRYERGDLSTDEYVTSFLGEFRLDLDPAEFLEDFATWPGALYPGAAEVVGDVRRAGVLTAALSNSNPVHWDSAYSAGTVQPLFDRAFASHQLRLAKPDPQIYLAVAETLGVAPERTVYFDDNQANVDGATAAGMVARRVLDPESARAALVEIGVLDG